MDGYDKLYVQDSVFGQSTAGVGARVHGWCLCLFRMPLATTAALLEPFRMIFQAPGYCCDTPKSGACCVAPCT